MMAIVGRTRWNALSRIVCQKSPAKFGVFEPTVAKMRPRTRREYDGSVRSRMSTTMTPPVSSPVKTAARAAWPRSSPPRAKPTPMPTAIVTTASISNVPQVAQVLSSRNGMIANWPTVPIAAMVSAL